MIRILFVSPHDSIDHRSDAYRQKMTRYFNNRAAAGPMSGGFASKNRDRFREKTPARRGCSLCCHCDTCNPFTRAGGKEDEARATGE